MINSEDEYEAMKQEILSRKRRVIFSNDGNDAAQASSYLRDPRDFLHLRTTPLVGSHVDTISYGPYKWGSFGLFSYRSDVGSTANSGGVFSALHERDTDPLEVTQNFCHENDMGIFWAMRMNDTHDATRPHFFEQNEFKNENRDRLLGTKEDPPAVGEWSAVDYGREDVRDMAANFVEEVCQLYDVDGIELNFFRHPILFRKTAAGEPVGQTELNQMTNLMRTINDILEREGRKRGRPFLLAVRTPDDIEYSTAIGLDIETWMEESLMDIFLPSGYFRLNTWEYSVDLGHEHGVQVYPCLSETRVGDENPSKRFRGLAYSLRASDECYRGRTMNGWHSGADGIYIFNVFDPHREMFWEIGDPDTLWTLDKVYFPSVRGSGSVAGGGYPHEDYNNIPILNPDEPRPLNPGDMETVDIRVGEQVQRPEDQHTPGITLSIVIRPEPIDTDSVDITINDSPLSGSKEGQLIECSVDPATVKAGTNTVGVRDHEQAESREWADAWITINYP